jgi:geranylgeranyl pyrophosphate synthase
LAYRDFGLYLGLAFQVQDDLLGIWGSAELTGKSAESDLVSGKKSLPVLFGLEQNGPFTRRWLEGPITSEEVPEVASLLRACGAYDFASQKAQELTEKALLALESARPEPQAGQALTELAQQLLSRRV